MSCWLLTEYAYKGLSIPHIGTYRGDNIFLIIFCLPPELLSDCLLQRVSIISILRSLFASLISIFADISEYGSLLWDEGRMAHLLGHRCLCDGYDFVWL